MVIIGAPDRVASFDVDAQNCFTPLCPEELPVADGHLIVSALNAQASLARYRLGSKDAHSPNAVWVASREKPQLSPVAGYSDADLHWNQHAVPGTLGFQLVEGLPSVTDYDFFVWKGVELDMHPYGACYHDQANKLSTGVIEFLNHKQVETVLVGGLALDFCVKTTVLQLRKAGFRVIVNLAATRSLSKETQEQAIDAMVDAGAEFVDDLSQIQAAPDTPVVA